jgi:hypothetical protein
MSVKLLSHDGKRLFEQRVVELQAVIQKALESFKRSSGGVEYGSARYQMMKHRLTEEDTLGPGLANLNDQIKELQMWLEKAEFWQKTNDTIILVNCPPAWAKVVFKKEIKGLLFLCCNAFFEVRGLYSEEEAKLLVRETIRKSKSAVNYLKFRQETPEADLEYDRLPIPETVRNEVWRRDQGKCAQCKSVRNLEFDHIIPVTRGGSNTARNIQLLCETCNRQKSDNIG